MEMIGRKVLTGLITVQPISDLPKNTEKIHALQLLQISGHAVAQHGCPHVKSALALLCT